MVICLTSVVFKKVCISFAQAKPNLLKSKEEFKNWPLELILTEANKVTLNKF